MKQHYVSHTVTPTEEGNISKSCFASIDEYNKTMPKWAGCPTVVDDFAAFPKLMSSRKIEVFCNSADKPALEAIMAAGGSNDKCEYHECDVNVEEYAALGFGMK